MFYCVLLCGYNVIVGEYYMVFTHTHTHTHTQVNRQYLLQPHLNALNIMLGILDLVRLGGGGEGGREKGGEGIEGGMEGERRRKEGECARSMSIPVIHLLSSAFPFLSPARLSTMRSSSVVGLVQVWQRKFSR